MNTGRAALRFVLALSAFVPCLLVAQSNSQRSSRDPVTGSTLGQNYPNPLQQETTIPFTIGGWPGCIDASKQYRVSLRVFNMLAQAVAWPVLKEGTAGAASGQPLREVTLGCGQYFAYWDGKHSSSGREAASGVYLYRLEVDGRPLVMKLLIVR